jgi:PST family polysaccharide transporter
MQARSGPSTDLGVDVREATLAGEIEELTGVSGGLGVATARGTGVTLAGQIAQVLMQVAAVVVLARLLSPRDYGLYAIVLVLVGVGEIFRDFGLSSAAIQAVTLTRLQRDNLFWINSALGVTLAGLAVVAAPWVAGLFHQPSLTAIIRVLAVTFVFNGLATQFRADLNRRLCFGRLAVTDLLGQFVGLTVAVVCAAAGLGYWALVASQLAQVGTVLVLVVVFARWRPRLPRRGVPLQSFLRYGWNFVATEIVNYFGNNVDSTVIALRFGAQPLGLYNRAFQLVMNPLNQFRSPATTVALPVMSRLQRDIPRANEYLRRAQLAIGYTIVAGLALGTGAAERVVHVALGSHWHQVTPLFALLAIAASFQMLSFVGYWAYLSRGLTGDLFRYTIVTFALRGVCIAAGSAWGLVGVAAGYAVAHALEWPLSLWWLSRRTDVPVRGLYLGAMRILATATLAGVATFGVCAGLRGWPDLPVLVVAGFAGVGIYALAGLLVGQIRVDLAGVADFARKFLPVRRKGRHRRPAQRRNRASRTAVPRVSASPSAQPVRPRKR